MSAIPCKRPKVVLEPRTTSPGEARYDAYCRVPGCSWTYPADKQFMALKSDAEARATMHRREHRDAVPKTDVGLKPAGPNYEHRGYYAACLTCMLDSPAGKSTRADVDAWLDYHLSTEHGLVTCP